MSYVNKEVTVPVYVDGSGGDVGAAIGYATGDFGSLCSYHTGPNTGINKWSKFKPVRSPERRDLTDEEFASREIGFGFDMVNIVHNNLPLLFKDADAKKEWQYNAPRGAKDNEWYRIMDFDRYHSSPTDIFDYSAVPESVEVPVGVGYLLPIRIHKKPTRDFDILDFAFTDGTFKYAIAYRKAGTTDFKLAIGDSISGTGETFKDDVFINIPIRWMGEYECLFVATQETQENPTGELTMWLSGGRFNIMVKEGTFKCETKFLGQYDDASQSVVPYEPDYNWDTGILTIPKNPTFELKPKGTPSLPTCSAEFGIKVTGYRTIYETFGTVEIWNERSGGNRLITYINNTTTQTVRIAYMSNTGSINLRQLFINAGVPENIIDTSFRMNIQFMLRKYGDHHVDFILNPPYFRNVDNIPK